MIHFILQIFDSPDRLFLVPNQGGLLNVGANPPNLAYLLAYARYRLLPSIGVHYVK